MTPSEALAAAINDECVLHGPSGSPYDSLTRCAPGILSALTQSGWSLVRTEVSADDLRARIETNLSVYQHRVDAGTATDFDRGKRAAFRVVLSMLDGPGEPTFSCSRYSDGAS